MTGWRIVAIATASDLGAADAAEALAEAHGLSFELLLVDGAPLDRSRWPRLARVVVARTGMSAPDPAQAAGIAAAALKPLAPPALILTAAGPFGQDCTAALAGMLDAELLGQPSRIALDAGGLVVERMAFGGRIRLDQRLDGGICIAALRPPSAPEAEVALPPQEMLTVDLPAPGLSIAAVALPERQAPLEGADLVVSGGRGIDAAGFALLEQIADSLGGALGGSLPAVDAGLVPVSRQVGQSGKFVTPRLYLAVGLSGTPQHLAGIGAATRIVAINSDPAAPIFTYAEAGCIADARALLPELAALLRR